MDRSLTSAEDAEYARWLTSSSLSTHDRNDEMLIAFKMAQRLSRPPTKVIRASRGQKGQGDLIDAVEAVVHDDADIEFWMDGRVRRVRFVPDTGPRH